MKLVSINGVLIASVNISIFIKTYHESQALPPLCLFILSVVFIALMILLEYEHRHFKTNEINIEETSYLFGKYIYLFALGLILTFLQKLTVLQQKQYFMMNKYLLINSCIHTSLLYYTLNCILGNSYLILFYREYQKANKNKLQWNLAFNQEDITCSICLSRVENGQKVAKITCMHSFHVVCLNKWVKQKPQCPLCLTKIELVEN